MAASPSFSLERNLKANKICFSVLSEVGEDVELLIGVIHQLRAALGSDVPLGLMTKRDPSPPRPDSDRQSGRRKSSSRGRKKTPERGRDRGNTKVTTPPTPPPPKPLIDQSGTKKSTWKNRMRSARQRALEDFEAFKMDGSEKTAAIFVNAYWTLRDQLANYRKSPFFNSVMADPLRDLPSEQIINGLASILDANGTLWKRDVVNQHFVIQNTTDGKSLRGEEIFTRL